MKDKICIITGATSGIGLSTALQLAQRGGRIGIVGRNKEKTEALCYKIKSTTKNEHIRAFIADLSSQQNIRSLAEEITQAYDHIDVLINNAAAVYVKPEYSIDGIEMQFAINHLSYFLLTHLLLDHIKKSSSSRIINVSSNAHFQGDINFDDLYHEKNYQGYRVYASCKLANVLFTYELVKRLQGSNVTVNAVHPGVVKTRIGNKHTKFWMGWIWDAISLFGISSDEGAKTSVYLASSDEVKGVSGKYFYKCKEGKSSEKSHDASIAEKLWQVSLDKCGLTESIQQSTT